MLESAADAAERVRRHIESSIATKRKILDAGMVPILAAARLMTQCLEEGGKILLCGNGGSAADAQHLAAEFVSVLNQGFLRPGLAGIALTTDTSILTASGNDFGFAGIYARQVQALGKPGDVVMGISTSGNSENVVRAIAYAQAHAMHSIVLTGEDGGRLAGIAEVAIQIPSSVTQFIQESHLMVGHILCDLVEQSLVYDEDGIVPKVSRAQR